MFRKKRHTTRLLLYNLIIWFTGILLLGCGSAIPLTEIENQKYEVRAEYYFGPTNSINIQIRDKNTFFAKWKFIYIDNDKSGDDATMEFLKDDLLLARIGHKKFAVWDHIWLFHLDNISPISNVFMPGDIPDYKTRKVKSDAKYNIISNTIDNISEVVYQNFQPLDYRENWGFYLHFKDADSADVSIMPDNIYMTEIYWRGGDRELIYIDPIIGPDSVFTIGLSYEEIIQKRNSRTIGE